jgi:hypothetical protein
VVGNSADTMEFYEHPVGGVRDRGRMELSMFCHTLSSFLLRCNADGVELRDYLGCELKFGYAEIFAQVSASGRSCDE